MSVVKNLISMFEDKNQETGNQKSLQKHQWVNGIWYNYDNKMTFWEIEGDKISMKSHYHFDHPDMKYTTGKISYGDFDEAKDEIYRATGYKNYNVLIEIDFEGFQFKLNAVITKTKTKMYTWGFTNKMEIINWVKKEDLEKIKNIREPYEAPKNPYYQPTPDKPGYLLWFSGPPGAGKSTSAQLLGRNHGYIYYEADCYMGHVNPYVDVNADDPSLEQVVQTPMKNSPKEAIEACEGAKVVFKDVMGGKFDNVEEALNPMYKHMANHVVMQRKRFGGSMAIAQAVFSQTQRDKLRKIIGPDLVFIVLNMTKECQRKRIKGRHGDTMPDSFLEVLYKYAEMCEPAGEDEENAFNVTITEDMSKSDVIQKILEIVNNLDKKPKKDPWRNGFWYNRDMVTQYWLVEGDRIEMRNVVDWDYPDVKPQMVKHWKYGDFGPANKEVARVSGIENSNIEIPTFFGATPAVLNDEGTKIYFYGFSKKVDVIEWLSDEEIEYLKEDRDSAEAPTCSYFEANPDIPRKIIWLSGPPGAGKSTSGQMLGRNHGYVYYEADCYGMFANPFVDPNVDEPTLQIMSQKPLKGVSRDVVAAVEEANPLIEELTKGNVNDEIMQLLQPMYDHMAADISKQNKRLGGKMAVAQAIYSRKQREAMGKIIGPECVFVVLNMSRECQKKRIIARHGEDMHENALAFLIKMAEMYEPAGEDEENAYNIEITEDMNREDVIKKILEIVDNLEEKKVEEKHMPWKNGFWYTKGSSSWLMDVKGDIQETKNLCALDYPDAKAMATTIWTYAKTLEEFGLADPEVFDATGVKYNNLKMEYDVGGDKKFSVYGVLNDAGTKLHVRGWSGKMDICEWLDDEAIEKLKEDREPFDAPSTHYTPKPNDLGKLIWLSGPPGAGKSTTAQRLARDNGFVYYEADAFFMFCNPFNPIDHDNPSMATLEQKPLKGFSVETIKAVEGGLDGFQAAQKGNGVTKELQEEMLPMFHEMALHINQQRKRLGGNWAIAQAVFSRAQRDQIRKDLGPDLIFMVLNLTRECQHKRVVKRHGEDEHGAQFVEMMEKYYDLYEPAGEDEQNAYNISITEDMSVEDVIQEILKIAENNQ